MQSAETSDHFEPRPHVQVVGISQNDLGLQFSQFSRTHGFDASLGADRHKCRSIDRAVRGIQSAKAGFGSRISFEQFKHVNYGDEQVALSNFARNRFSQ
jgi:hypothetical protein